MANLYCVTKELWKSRTSLSDFKIYSGTLTREDVATLIETFQFALEESTVEVISDVLENSGGFFAFLVDKNCGGTFDFYKFLNDHYDGDVKIGPTNAKMMFPRSLSRGIYFEYENDSTGEVYGDEESEGATGYIDDEPEVNNEPIHESKKTVTWVLKHEGHSDEVVVTMKGVVIGRSNKTADFVLTGDGNVSRTHCRVYLRNGYAFIEDKNSSNGTYVNGDKVVAGRDVQLDVGDAISLSTHKFTVEKR